MTLPLSPRLLLSLLAFGVPFGIYSWTQAHVWALDTLYAIDSAEMVIAAHTLGIDHPPGHPLYLILAHLFSLLPFALPDGGVIFASVTFGALAALLLTLAIYETTGDLAASLGAGWTFAFAWIFWLHATIAEVYTLQLAFLGLFLTLSARWLGRREERDFHLLFFTLGLSAATNVLLTALLLPAVLLLAVRSGAVLEGDRWQKKRLFTALLWGILGLTPFLYIPIRLSQEGGFITDFVTLNGYNVQSFRWYWWYLSAEEFTTTRIAHTPAGRYPLLLLDSLRIYAANASPAAPVLAVTGLLMAAIAGLKGRRTASPHPNGRKDRRRTRRSRPRLLNRLFTPSASGSRLFEAVLAVALFCTLLPVLSYQVPDRDVFFMPSFTFLSAFVGLGLHRIRNILFPRLPRSLSPLIPPLLACTLPIYLLIHHYPAVVRTTGDRTLYRQRLERFERLPPNATILGEDDGHATRYKYFQIVRRLRPDVTIQTLGRLAPRFRGEIDLDRSIAGAGDLSVSLNLADRLRILNGLIKEHPDRPLFAILDDRMPPEYDHFRTVRSAFDPYLLRVSPKPPAEESPDPLPVVTRSETDTFEDLRFVGFGIEGLDRNASKAFSTPLTFGNRPVDGIVQRGELFELSFVVRRTAPPGAQLFAEFAFVNDRLEIPTMHGFTAAKQIEIIPETLPRNWYRKDRVTFKIPGYIPRGFYTLAVSVTRTTGRIGGVYRGKPIQTLTPLRMARPWKGQYVYHPLGQLWVE